MPIPNFEVLRISFELTSYLIFCSTFVRYCIIGYLRNMNDDFVYLVNLMFVALTAAYVVEWRRAGGNFNNFPRFQLKLLEPVLLLTFFGHVVKVILTPMMKQLFNVTVNLNYNLVYWVYLLITSIVVVIVIPLLG